MSTSSDSGSWTIPSSAADPQTMAALLNGLLPLLLQIQMRSRGQGPQSGGPHASGMHAGGMSSGLSSGPNQQLGFAQFPPGSIGADALGVGALVGQFAPPHPVIDYQAAVNMAENMAADSLRTLAAYLEANSGQQQGLDGCIAIVVRAANCFAARDYAQTLGLIWEAYRNIAALRAANPHITPPRAAGFMEASFSSQPPISH